MQEWTFLFWLLMDITEIAPVGIATRTFRLPAALWVCGLSESPYTQPILYSRCLLCTDCVEKVLLEAEVSS
jgi:hypothetical protein